MGAYLDTVLPVYGEHFADWWHDRLVPEMQRNFASLEERLDAAAGMSLAEVAVLLEDAIDMHDRHWKIHWMLNFAQLSATLNLRAVMEKHRGGVDEQLLGRLQNSASDRNWDSIEALWRMKNEVRDDAELRTAFSADEVPDIVRNLRATERGQRFIAERVEPYQREFGWHAVWSHEFIFPTVREHMEPAIELVRGYLTTDYDFPTAIEAMRADIEAASREILEGLSGDALEEMRAANAVNLRMAPLTPDHHFYIDQGANAHVRLVLIEVGRKLVDAGRLDEPDDVMFLRYNELRSLIGSASALDARSIVAAPTLGARGRRAPAPARLGRHGDAVAARLPVSRQLGLPGPLLPDAVGRRAVDHGDRRVARRDRGGRPGRANRRRIRRGPRRRHPRLPDDEPGLGRPVHEDRGPRHRHRRHDLASGRAVARIRDPGRHRHVGGDPTHRHRRPHQDRWNGRQRRDPARRGGPTRGRRGIRDRVLALRPFEYERPTRLDDAIALLASGDPEARPLAGGTDLIIRLRDGTIRPRTVVDIKGIAELDGDIREDGSSLRIGARTVMTDIVRDERIRRDFEALAEGAAVVGSAQIRNRATLAGNICNASPAADTVPALLVYERESSAWRDRRALDASRSTSSS